MPKLFFYHEVLIFTSRGYCLRFELRVHETQKSSLDMGFLLFVFMLGCLLPLGIFLYIQPSTRLPWHIEHLE